jgi:hypothetical protein
MGTPFSTPQVEEKRSWTAIGVGTGVIIIALIVVFILSRNQPQQIGPAPEDPYASNLKITDVRASQAQNFAGGSVYYIEGQIANMGSKSIIGGSVEAVFRNSLGQVVDRQTQPLTILQERPGYTDAISLREHPLTPNMQDRFRLTFEHISADWNQGVPELRFVKLNFQ